MVHCKTRKGNNLVGVMVKDKGRMMVPVEECLIGKEENGKAFER